MTGRRALVGLSLICALAFTAFSAASASAAPTTEGTTAYTCVADPTNHASRTQPIMATSPTPTVTRQRFLQKRVHSNTCRFPKELKQQ